MGGKQYAIGKARTVNGVYYPSFDTVAHLLEDYGCLHFKFSILLGISEPAYDPEQLAAFKAADKETFEFEGQKYTKYEASQVQRKLETEIRRQKDRANIAKAAGDDDMRRQAQEKINHLTSKYKKFSDASGLPTKAQRMSVAGFRRVKSTSEIADKVLTTGINSGNIKLSNVAVRKAYIKRVANIPNEIDTTLPFEEQARQAFELRNKYRTNARTLMADEEKRKELEAKRPNKTFEELIADKMKRKGMTREEAIEDIYKTATKTNENVDKKVLGG